MALRISRPFFPSKPMCKHCRSSLRQLPLDFSTGTFKKQSPAFSVHCPRCDGPDLANPLSPPAQ